MSSSNESLKEHPTTSISVNVTGFSQMLTTLRLLIAPFEIKGRPIPIELDDRNFKVVAEYSTNNRAVTFDFWIDESPRKFTPPCATAPNEAGTILQQTEGSKMNVEEKTKKEPSAVTDSPFEKFCESVTHQIYEATHGIDEASY